MVPVAILCGGKGTRIARGEEDVPKPLVEVGGRPIVWHVMALYAAQGFSEFTLLTGWQAEAVERTASCFGEVQSGDWTVRFLDTGVETTTGGRVAQVRGLLGEATFGLTYADGVADIDLASELAFHRSHGAAATLATVKPTSPWGKARLEDDGQISGFVEKPRLESWINGGFMFLEPRSLDYIHGDEPFESGPLERLAEAGELFGFRHDGFWDCMDTFKDRLVLDELCATGEPPWLKAAVAR